jgi:NAD(P)-dependent dehydrogenase (short-subunit alcohol dehydrogenase family)
MSAKAVLVTGGARGIGLGIAERLDRLGYRVAVADLQRAETPFFFVRCDVSREAAVRACVPRCA